MFFVFHSCVKIRMRRESNLLRPAMKFPAFRAKIPQWRTTPAATALCRQLSSASKTGRANNVTILKIIWGG